MWNSSVQCKKSNEESRLAGWHFSSVCFSTKSTLWLFFGFHPSHFSDGLILLTALKTKLHIFYGHLMYSQFSLCQMVIESPPLGLTIILCSPLYDQYHYIVRVWAGGKNHKKPWTKRIALTRFRNRWKCNQLPLWFGSWDSSWDAALNTLPFNTLLDIDIVTMLCKTLSFKYSLQLLLTLYIQIFAWSVFKKWLIWVKMYGFNQ